MNVYNLRLLYLIPIAVLLMACDQTGSDYYTSDDGIDRGDSWSAVQAEDGGRVEVLYVPAGGWAYRDEKGELTGVTVEIMRDFKRWVSREHGVSLEMLFVTETDWRQFYQRVVDAEGGVFGIGNVTITEGRREELAFSPPYLTNIAVLISHESMPELPAMNAVADHFSGLSALAFDGTLHEERLKVIQAEHAPDLNIDKAESNDEIIAGVSAGDYFAYIDAYNYWRAKSQGSPLKRHPVADDPGEEFGVIMPLGSDWGPLVEDFFRADGGYTNSERYRELLRKHLGEEVAEVLL